VLQWHGYTFDLPKAAIHHAWTRENQLSVTASLPWLQCHLELDERLINRWLNYPEYRQDLEERGRGEDAEAIREQTHRLIGQSVALSQQVFGGFLAPLGEARGRHVLPSR
jgi:GMP synthase (glutamine-hydrolysing)